MTATAYRGVPTLADHYLNLIRQGLYPDEAARHLTAEIRREHLVLDPHPRWPFDLIPTTDGRLTVETANGRRDDASEFLISIERLVGIRPCSLPTRRRSTNRPQSPARSR